MTLVPGNALPFALQVEDLKSKLASQEAELQLRNQDAEALIAKTGFQTEKLSLERAIADTEEQKVSLIPPFSAVELYLAQNKPFQVNSFEQLPLQGV